MKIYESKENEDCRIIVDKGKDIIFVLNEPLVLAGDVKFEFSAKALSKGKFATFWINTTFTPEEGVLALNKVEIDKACKDTSNKELPEKFWIEVRYHTHIDKSVLPNVNTSRVIRPVSVLGLSSPLSSDEEIPYKNSERRPSRRASTSDVVTPNLLNTEGTYNKSGLTNSSPINEVDEDIKRSDSLPNILTGSDQRQDTEVVRSDEETDED
eukprot:NODE_256_length_12667_cov_0.196292.p7 type:complete len:211 gc:universal NODE_256_length_12667_cov_0.196292:4133-4765(+)